MIYNKPIYPDPGIQHGHYRVLPYAPGGFVVIDERRQFASQTVLDSKGKRRVWRSAEQAGFAALRYSELSPECLNEQSERARRPPGSHQ
jgi:hypothetical protein